MKKVVIILIIVDLTLLLTAFALGYNKLNNRINKIEKSFNAPVVVTPSLDVSDEHTQDIVKQAYQYLCEEYGFQPFDFGYELSYGGNDSHQMLIFVTFYYSWKNDPYPYTHVTKLVNYYENPQEWEIVSDELGYN